MGGRGTSIATLTAPGRRSDSRALTRKRLLEFGRRAFARKGHAGTNLRDDILIPARVSVGSFYHQFKDKTDLFLEILREQQETFRAMIREAHTPRGALEPGAVARHSYQTVFRIAEQNDDLFRIMMREQGSEDLRVRQYLRDNHRRWVESLAEDYRQFGLVGPAADRAELAAELISAMTFGTVLSYLDRPPRERARLREILIEGLVQFTLGGVLGLVSTPPPNDRSVGRGPIVKKRDSEGAFR